MHCGNLCKVSLSDCRIDILLATYNSESYLSEQIDSILSQTDVNWRLLIHDGGSADSTLEIIADYVRRDFRIVFLGSKKLEAVENFARLLENSDAELTMFADHDDVWLDEKIARERAKIVEMGRQNGENMPLLVFSDSAIVDENLNSLHGSMLIYQHLDPEKGLSFPRLILQNVASGNTILLNRALRELMLPFPPEVVMHDHWAMLTAAYLGRIGFINESLLLYRQHGDNVLGAKAHGWLSMLEKLFQHREVILGRFYGNIAQAEAFLRRHREKLDVEKLKLLDDLAVFGEAGFFRKRQIIWRHGIWKSGILRNLGMLFFV